VTAVFHRRSLDIEVVETASADEFGVLGHLRDERPWQDDPMYRVLHDMRIELRVDTTTMTITSATSQMDTFPHAECPFVVDRFGDLVGLSVARGYSRSLRSVFGGVTGCAHLYELARAAGSAIVQGTLSRGQATGQRSMADPESIKRGLTGMCHIWDADGPGPVKLDLGWRPGAVREYPAPTVERLRESPRNR